jgi:predicted RNA-binding protein (virulence factor B family)
MPGEAFTGYVYALREDGKIDVRMRPQGFQAANPDARERILAALAEAGGSLTLSDNSTPQEIQNVLGLSKKAFKVACGTLWKEKLIDRDQDKIRLSARSSGS